MRRHQHRMVYKATVSDEISTGTPGMNVDRRGKRGEHGVPGPRGLELGGGRRPAKVTADAAGTAGDTQENISWEPRKENVFIKRTV